jgi:hypothetical protein
MYLYAAFFTPTTRSLLGRLKAVPRLIPYVSVYCLVSPTHYTLLTGHVQYLLFFGLALLRCYVFLCSIYGCSNIYNRKLSKLTRY